MKELFEMCVIVISAFLFLAIIAVSFVAIVRLTIYLLGKLMD